MMFIRVTAAAILDHVAALLSLTVTVTGNANVTLLLTVTLTIYEQYGLTSLLPMFAIRFISQNMTLLFNYSVTQIILNVRIGCALVVPVLSMPFFDQ